jgi:hypothetical protein
MFYVDLAQVIVAVVTIICRHVDEERHSIRVWGNASSYSVCLFYPVLIAVEASGWTLLGDTEKEWMLFGGLAVFGFVTAGLIIACPADVYTKLPTTVSAVVWTVTATVVILKNRDEMHIAIVTSIAAAVVFAICCVPCVSLLLRPLGWIQLAAGAAFAVGFGGYVLIHSSNRADALMLEDEIPLIGAGIWAGACAIGFMIFDECKKRKKGYDHIKQTR